MEKITRNFFLSYQGVCLKNNLLLLDSVHRYPTIVYKQYYRALKDYYIARFARSGKYKELDQNKIYLVVNHPWFNYYHWIAESIPRIIRYKERLSELTLMLPQSIYDVSFVKESLLPFQFKDIEINEDGWHYHIPKGIISPLQNYCYRYDATLINKTRELYINYFVENDNAEPFRKIYISRKNASRRKFINEEDLISLMKKYDFEIVELESATLKDQVNLFSEAKLVVSMHGAALTNMLFMTPKTTVIEMYRKKSTPFELKSKVYKNLAPVLGINHFEIACLPVNKQDDFFTGNQLANLFDLEKTINSVCL
jgi:capsular polysaccharide biosynthesis protein